MGDYVTSVCDQKSRKFKEVKLYFINEIIAKFDFQIQNTASRPF